jgi:hypothetical protein
MLSPFLGAVTSPSAVEIYPAACGEYSAVLSFVGSTFTLSPTLSNPAKLKSQRAASLRRRVRQWTPPTPDDAGPYCSRV